MKGLEFDCSTDGHIPYGPLYTGNLLVYVVPILVSYISLDAAFKVCNLPGAQPGLTAVRGEDYLSAEFDFNSDHTAIDAIVVLALWLFYIIVNALAVEKLEWLHGGFIKRVFKRGRAPITNDDATEVENVRKAMEATSNMQPMEVV
jgi:ATP-binding cassette subfamily G (WHITE) protein 2 (SNQ2)